VSVTLKDISEKRNHSVIVGDMFDEKKKAEIVQDFLQGQKVDLIFERAKMGQKYYPRDAHFIGKQLAFWYKHLADNGVMFLTPPFAVRDEYVEPWMKMIQESYAGQIEVQANEGYDAIRIRKLPGAPEHLPLIDQRASFRSTLREKKGGRTVTKPASIK
jgi:hypothetical protein